MDLAEIFREHGPAYREKFGARMPESHRRAMDAIRQGDVITRAVILKKSPAADDAVAAAAAARVPDK